MKCPFCAIDATYPHNLSRHLSGKAGHGIPVAKADQIARAVFDGSYRPEAPKVQAGTTRSVIPPQETPEPATPEPPPARQGNGYAGFLEALFDMMVANKALPKFQFERRVDAFFDLFLPDLLSARFTRFISLAPMIPARLCRPPDLAAPRLYPLTFAELGQLPVTRFPEVWVMFRRLVHPALAGRHA